MVDPILTSELKDLEGTYTFTINVVLMHFVHRVLAKDAHHMILCDGVDENLKLCASLEQLDWWASKRRMLQKLAANSTSKTQICDLLQLHHTTKEPAVVIKKCIQRDFDLWHEQMKSELKDAKCHLGDLGVKFLEFTQALGLLFGKIFPDQRASEIQSKWSKLEIFTCDLETARLLWSLLWLHITSITR
jgi:hypothetical protein